MALKKKPSYKVSTKSPNHNRKPKKNKEPENWNNMAYLMVMMQDFFLFLCFLLLEESSCNEANVAAIMLDAQAAAKLATQERKHAQRRIVGVAALSPLGFWTGVLES
jgi:hypothetical protein